MEQLARGEKRTSVACFYGEEKDEKEGEPWLLADLRSEDKARTIVGAL